MVAMTPMLVVMLVVTVYLMVASPPHPLPTPKCLHLNPPEPVNATLFGKRVPVDVKLRIMT